MTPWIGRWSALRVSRVLLVFHKAIWTMSAATLATVSALQVVLAREDHQAIFKVVVHAFDERFGHYGRISTLVPSGTSFQISSISSLVTATHPRVQSCNVCAEPTHPYP